MTASAKPTGILEVIYTWPDGREEIRYTRPYPSDEAKALEAEVLSLMKRFGDQCPYMYRVRKLEQP